MFKLPLISTLSSDGVGADITVTFSLLNIVLLNSIFFSFHGCHALQNVTFFGSGIPFFWHFVEN